MAALKLPETLDEVHLSAAPIMGFAAVRVREKWLGVIPAANAGDVALEQLTYLVEHARHCCAIGCQDCMRLQGAVAVLNKVFG